jgi:hypothetical protein
MTSFNLEIVVETVYGDGTEEVESIYFQGPAYKCLALAKVHEERCIDMYLNRVSVNVAQIHFLNEVLRP